MLFSFCFLSPFSLCYLSLILNVFFLFSVPVFSLLPFLNFKLFCLLFILYFLLVRPSFRFPFLTFPPILFCPFYFFRPFVFFCLVLVFFHLFLLSLFLSPCHRHFLRISLSLPNFIYLLSTLFLLVLHISVELWSSNGNLICISYTYSRSPVFYG